jgi:hypothetical protein
MADDKKFSTKQLKAIPKILAARTYDEGCKAAGISKATFYTWMQDEAFKAELERRRNELVETAFAMVTQNVEKAVSTLVALLDAADDRVKRLTANDIIATFLKQKELAEFEERIAAIEAQLEAK